MNKGKTKLNVDLFFNALHCYRPNFVFHHYHYFGKYQTQNKTSHFVQEFLFKKVNELCMQKADLIVSQSQVEPMIKTESQLKIFRWCQKITFLAVCPKSGQKIQLPPSLHFSKHFQDNDVLETSNFDFERVKSVKLLGKIFITFPTALRLCKNLKEFSIEGTTSLLELAQCTAVLRGLKHAIDWLSVRIVQAQLNFDEIIDTDLTAQAKRVQVYTNAEFVFPEMSLKNGKKS